jgi:hypothetical protein
MARRKQVYKVTYPNGKIYVSATSNRRTTASMPRPERDG